jgi:hypothetical protein
MLYLGLESARRAVDDLVEFEPTHTERLMVILLSELTAYRFLLKQHHEKNEIRHRRLALRGCCYGRLWYQLGQLMNEQRTKLLAGANDKDASDVPSREEEQWAAAVQLWPALEKSLEQTNSLLPFQCSAAEFRLKASRLS